MSVSLPNPSSRLLRAAVAERTDLVRHRERPTHEQSRLLGELRELDEALAGVNRRLEVLAELAGEPGDSTPGAPPALEAPGNGVSAPGASPDEHPTLLRGPPIRE